MSDGNKEKITPTMNCAEFHKPHVFRNSNRCKTCGWHRMPATASGVMKTPRASLMVRI